MAKQDFSSEIISLVREEKQKFERSSQDIRRVIKQSRQNYQNMYKQPVTRNGRRKKFVPLTRWECDTITSKVFVNDKAITVLPRTEGDVFASLIAEQTLKHQMNRQRFPSVFRNSFYDLSRDGTTVWAAYWDFKAEIDKPEETKKFRDKIKKLFKKNKNTRPPKLNVLRDTIGFSQVDLLNVYIDPTADSIQDAQSIIVRNTMPLSRTKMNKLWENTDQIQGYTIEINDEWDQTSTRKWDIRRPTVEYEQPMVSVHSRWGDFPLAFITGDPKDMDTMVHNGVIEIADMDKSQSTPVILRVDVNPFDHQMKPFEECWFQKVKGRWYGIGVGEKLIDLQSSVNKNFNRKEENEDILHSGMFVVKRGSGISAKSIRSKPGAVIEADNVDDIKQLQIRDVSQLSDGSINMVFDMARRATGAADIAIGSSADRSATTSIIKDRNADTRFAAVRGNVNDFLIRFFTQWLALDRQFLTEEFVLRVTNEDMDFDMLDRFTGITREESEKLPKFRFINVKPSTIRNQFDLFVDIDLSQPQNKLENAQRILEGIQVGRQMGIQRDYEKMYDAYLDNLGLTGLSFKTRVKQPPLEMLQQGQQAQTQTPGVGELEQVLTANQTAPQSGVEDQGPELPPSVLGQF